MLALAGGGIRGLISLGILKRLEESLAAVSGSGSAFRLCDFFDYIAEPAPAPSLPLVSPAACPSTI